jgi:hypothetical protein
VLLDGPFIKAISAASFSLSIAVDTKNIGTEAGAGTSTGGVVADMKFASSSSHPVSAEVLINGATFSASCFVDADIPSSPALSPATAGAEDAISFSFGRARL